MDPEELETPHATPLERHNSPSLTSHPNTRAPVFNLPKELLCEIFLLLAESCPLSVWLPLNLVCRTWREVAVGTARLWAKPATHHHELTLLMLKRSKMADLVVKIDANTADATTAAIMGHTQHIRTLSINQPTRLLQSSCELLHVSIEHASRLEEVSLHDASPPPAPDPNPIVSVASVAFHRLPRLRKLDICWVQFDWKILPMPQLTHLSLLMAGIPTTNSFFEKLAQMPHLESIVLCSGALPSIDPAHADSTAICLPRLTRVVLDYAPYTVFLPRLKATRLRVLRLYMPHLNDGCTPFSVLLSAALLQGDFGRCRSWTVSPSTFSFTEGIGRDGLFVDVLHSFPTDDPVVTVLTKLDGRILSKAKDLLFYKHTPSVDLLQVCASRLPNVEIIILQSDDICRMMQLIPQKSDPILSDMAFPKLREICFYSLTNVQDVESWDEVIDWLRLRQRCGVPIKKLKLSDLNRPSHSVEASIRELGIELHVGSTSE